MTTTHRKVSARSTQIMVACKRAQEVGCHITTVAARERWGDSYLQHPDMYAEHGLVYVQPGHNKIKQRGKKIHA